MVVVTVCLSHMVLWAAQSQQGEVFTQFSLLPNNTTFRLLIWIQDGDTPKHQTLMDTLGKHLSPLCLQDQLRLLFAVGHPWLTPVPLVRQQAVQGVKVLHERASSWFLTCFGLLLLVPFCYPIMGLTWATDPLEMFSNLAQHASFCDHISSCVPNNISFHVSSNSSHISSISPTSSSCHAFKVMFSVEASWVPPTD